VVWDELQKGLALVCQPSGHMAYKCIYSRHGRPRWYHIADTRAVGLADARKLAAHIMLQVATGADPQAERKAQRAAGTFLDLAMRYRAYAEKTNKSWRQAAALVDRHLLPKWGKAA
jgi:Arm domain-containing DNA-binding protein